MVKTKTLCSLVAGVALSVSGCTSQRVNSEGNAIPPITSYYVEVSTGNVVTAAEWICVRDGFVGDGKAVWSIPVDLRYLNTNSLQKQTIINPSYYNQL